MKAEEHFMTSSQTSCNHVAIGTFGQIKGKRKLSHKEFVAILIYFFSFQFFK